MKNDNFKKISEELKNICNERMMFSYKVAMRCTLEKNKKFYLRQYRFWRKELLKLL